MKIEFIDKDAVSVEFICRSGGPDLKSFDFRHFIKVGKIVIVLPGNVFTRYFFGLINTRSGILRGYADRCFVGFFVGCVFLIFVVLNFIVINVFRGRIFFKVNLTIFVLNFICRFVFRLVVPGEKFT